MKLNLVVLDNAGRYAGRNTIMKGLTVVKAIEWYG